MNWTALLLAAGLFLHGVEAPVDAFIESARNSTIRYQDQSNAILDGYQRIGRDFPAMGEHWINTGLAFDGKFDVAHPEVLTYIVVSGKPRLLGVAYALPLLEGESVPSEPAGKEAWHDHFRTLDDETLLPQHQSAGQANDARITMLHAWIWAPNPDGMFAADNWNIPYLRLGIPRPAEASTAAAKALSLAAGGEEYFKMSVDAAARPNGFRRKAIENAFERARVAVEALLHDRPAVALELTPRELGRLSDIWNELWQKIETSISREGRIRLQQIHLR